MSEKIALNMDQFAGSGSLRPQSKPKLRKLYNKICVRLVNRSPRQLVCMSDIAIAPARDLALSSVTIFSPSLETLANRLVGDNFDLADPHIARHRDAHYGQRERLFDGVDLLRLPPGSKICSGGHSLAMVSDCLLAEQLPPAEYSIHEKPLSDSVQASNRVVQVDGPSALVVRYGHMTWGHWVGELLPRIVLAERACPGVFRFVLPWGLNTISYPRNVFNALAETLLAIGLDSDRWLIARPDTDYIFSELHLISSVYVNDWLHPRSIAATRDAMQTPLLKPCRRLALLRCGAHHRNMTNTAELARPLQARGFEFVELNRMPFRDQITMFAAAEIVVSALASEMMGLMFAPLGTTVISLGPEGYLNNFFYSIMRERKQNLYDLRGPTERSDLKVKHFSDYTVDPTHLVTALNDLGV
jgi:hypothetical protein